MRDQVWQSLTKSQGTLCQNPRTGKREKAGSNGHTDTTGKDGFACVHHLHNVTCGRVCSAALLLHTEEFPGVKTKKEKEKRNKTAQFKYTNHIQVTSD